MSDAAVYRSTPTPAALQLIRTLTDAHADQALDAAHELLLRKIATYDRTMGIALEAYCLLRDRGEHEEWG